MSDSSLIVGAGCAGLGLLWGWLSGGFAAHSRPSLRTLLVLIIVTLLLTLQVVGLVNRPAVTLFLGAALLAFLLRRAWQAELMQRFGARTLPGPKAGRE